MPAEQKTTASKAETKYGTEKMQTLEWPPHEIDTDDETPSKRVKPASTAAGTIPNPLTPATDMNTVDDSAHGADPKPKRKKMATDTGASEVGDITSMQRPQQRRRD